MCVGGSIEAIIYTNMKAMVKSMQVLLSPVLSTSQSMPDVIGVYSVIITMPW